MCYLLKLENLTRMFHSAASEAPVSIPPEGSAHEKPVGNRRSASRLQAHSQTQPRGAGGAFTFPDFLVVLAVLAILVAVLAPMLSRNNAQSSKAQCINNVRQVTRAVLMYADEHKGTLPLMGPDSMKDTWWWYKEMVKGYAGIHGASSRRDKVFACPDDRGYDENGPFCLSAKFDFQSYVFNGVNLPGLPNIAGRQVGSVASPSRTLLLMEFPAHGPYSWHDSKTGEKNHPFYNDAESVVGFVDGQVKYIRIYYDGINPAYTRDPIPGYEYKYSGD